MKPEKLVMSAFGSYGRVETIDFTAVDHGLFLIAGDTGSGKSTIFDAIMFALYDTMSGRERKGYMMRSEYASDTIETYVAFTFSYGAHGERQRYTVKRYPAYDRKAKRKNKEGVYGITRQPARVSLILPDGKEFVGKVNDTNQKIQEIIGLTAEQFHKIAMIAQGEFQELIMDRTGKRKEIFQQIFATGIYEKIERKILEEYRESQKSFQENLTQLHESVRGVILECTGNEAEWEQTLPFLETDAERIQKFLEDSIDKTKVLLAEEKKELEALERQQAEANQAYQEKLSLNQDIANLEREEMIQKELLSQKEKMEDLKKQSELAKRAKDVQKYEEEYLRRHEERIRAEAEKKKQEVIEKEYREQLEEAVERKERKNREYREKQPALLRRIHQITEELEHLSQLGRCLEKLETKKKELDQNRKEQNACREEGQKLEQEKEETERWLELHQGLELSLEKEEQKRLQAEGRKERLEDFERAYRAFFAQWRQLYEEEKALAQIMRYWKKCRQEYEDKSDAYIAAQSYFLAKELQKGQPCPVCGSIEHPAPAKQTNGTVTKDELEAAKEKEQQAQQKKEFHQQSVQAQKSLVEKGKQDLIQSGEKLFDLGQQPEEELGLSAGEEPENAALPEIFQKEYEKNDQGIQKQKQKLSILQEEKKEKEIKQKKTDDIVKEIQKYRDKLQEREEKGRRTEMELRELEVQKGLLQSKVSIRSGSEGQKEQKELEGQLEQLSAEVAQAEENAVQWKRKYDTLLGEREANQKLLKKLYTEEAETETLFCEAWKRNGFAGKEAYFAARSLYAGQQEREQSIQQYERKKLQNDTRLETLEQRIAGRKKASVDEIQKQLCSLQEKKEQKNEWIRKLSYQHQTNAKIFARVERLLKEQGTLAAHRKVMASLNSAANGRVHFQTYVQRQYFKKIIQAANKRLQKMTANRFLLQCRDLDKTGQGESGLDLDVYNPATGKSRDAHTLSGGETFLASLSMALGMADVVQNTVGKTHIDTMFVDEGFGSLSEEVRDTAVRVLLELAGGNRLVGVISHVNELKEQIPNQLIVTKGNHGSQVTWKKD